MSYAVLVGRFHRYYNTCAINVYSGEPAEVGLAPFASSCNGPYT